MAYALVVPGPWATQGWKVKIRDDERNETPHVTFLRKRDAWRLSLRSCEFLDARPDPGLVPRELLEHVWDERKVLRRTWNAMYPENPVYSTENRT